MPVKTLVAAKTRLAAAAGPHRAALAVAIACDTVDGRAGCRVVARVVVVTADPVAGAGARRARRARGARPGRGAERRAAAPAAPRRRGWRPDDPVGALQADLPALRPGGAGVVLAAAADFEPGVRARTPPRSAPPSTACGPGVPFTPGFGGESRAPAPGRRRQGACAGRHRRRCGRDVDTPADLRGGAGPRRRPPHAGDGEADLGVEPGGRVGPARSTRLGGRGGGEAAAGPHRERGEGRGRRTGGRAGG